MWTHTLTQEGNLFLLYVGGNVHFLIAVSDHCHFIPRTISMPKVINHSASYITIDSRIEFSCKYISLLKYSRTDVFPAEQSFILCRGLDFQSFSWLLKTL